MRDLNTTLPSQQQENLTCATCGYHHFPEDGSEFATFTCNVRAFKTERFQVWRCPECATIHCLEKVDLRHYYAQYPYQSGTLSAPLRLLYGRLLRTLHDHGLRGEHTLLDYGCGASALLVRYLREKGVNAFGYDPYSPNAHICDPAVLECGPFDCLILQDVIEHAEDPRALLARIDRLLAPGGLLLVSTPNAERIDLSQPQSPAFYNAVHVPYHLHLYTRRSVEAMMTALGWKSISFSERGVSDTPWFGLNVPAMSLYQCFGGDGTLNVLFEPIKILKVLSSPRLLFFAMFGYWLSPRTDMTLLFRRA